MSEKKPKTRDAEKAKREIQRRRVWQESRIVQGQCSICGIEALYRDERCLKCYLRRHLRRKGFPKETRLMDMVHRQFRNELRYLQKVFDAELTHERG